MDEKSIIKRSYKVCLILSILFLIASIIFKDISLILGYILGYIISYLVFQINIYVTDFILALQRAYMLVALSFGIKMLLYALGFIMAIKLSIFHIVTVFVGYLSTKVSIYIEGYINKGGEVNK